MELLLGFLFGSAMRRDGITILIALPFVAWFMVFCIYAMWNASSWYEASVAASYTVSPWYSWPWNWPGVHLVERAFNGITPLIWPDLSGDSPGILNDMRGWVLTIFKALIAACINVWIAILPLQAAGMAIRLIKRLRAPQIGCLPSEKT